MSRSLEQAKTFLNREVRVIIDRPLGSMHPKNGTVYPINYGYIPDTLAPDGAELDAYVLGVDGPLAEFTGVCIAIVHREDDDDDKCVVTSFEKTFTDKEILELVNFQEKWFKSSIIR